MTQTLIDPALQRSRRKQDLLLASRLARGQVLAAFDQLADQADGLALRVVRIRVWLSSPLVWAAGTAAGLGLAIGLRRLRAMRLLRWGWVAWRLWRSAGPALARYRATR